VEEIGLLNLQPFPLRYYCGTSDLLSVASVALIAFHFVLFEEWNYISLERCCIMRVQNL
jgi:hypothetical protein